MYQKGNQNQ